MPLSILSLGSSASRNPSPNMFKPITSVDIAIPGNIAICGAVNKKSRPLLNMAPHSGEGGCAPSPKNDNPAADKIAVAKRKVAWTIIGDKILGICVS